MVDFFVAFGLAAVLGLLAALEPEPLRALVGVPALEPSFGGALLTAGEDMVVFVRDWMVGFEMGSCVVDMKNQNPVGELQIERNAVVSVKGREVYFVKTCAGK